MGDINGSTTGDEPTNTGRPQHSESLTRCEWLLETAILAVEILSEEEALKHIERHARQLIAETEIYFARIAFQKRLRSGEAVHGQDPQAAKEVKHNPACICVACTAERLKWAQRDHKTPTD